MQKEPNITYQQKIISFESAFSLQALDDILAETESKLLEVEPAKKIRKRIFCILVEALQNVHNYLRIENVKDERLRTVKCFLEKQGDEYILQVGNYILADKIDGLRDMIEKINRYSNDFIQKHYIDILANQELSPEGGAGLGLLDLVRKSGNNIRYKIRKINHEINYFLLHLNISTK